MKLEKVLEELYDITDEDVIHRLVELQRYISIKKGKDWNAYYIAGILNDRLSEPDMQEYISEYNGHETVCPFNKAISIVFDLKNNDEIVDLLSDYIKSNSK